MQEYLTLAEAESVQQVVTETGLDDPNLRRLVFEGVDRGFSTSLRHFAVPSLQVWSDLMEMRTTRLVDGQVPIVLWLRNARRILGPREEGRVLEAVLATALTRVDPRGAEVRPGHEGIIHDDDLVPASFVTEASEALRSVALVQAPRCVGGQQVLRDDVPVIATGTTWLVAKALAITAYHVVACRREGEPPPNDDDLELQALASTVEFDYDSGDAYPVPEKVLALVVADPVLDYALLEITTSAARPSLVLATAAEIEAVARDEKPANIIQHPGGGPKACGLRNNMAMECDALDLTYLTDTTGGSSGAPVCSDEWRVLALHKHHVRLPSPRTFQGRETWTANRGTRIDRIARHIEENAPAIWSRIARG